jgi:hypothetical protein
MSPSKYKEEAEVELVDDMNSIHECLADLYPNGKPRSPESGSVAVDLEGVNLGRTGRVSIMQVYASKSKKIWIVDITTLGKKAFDEKDKYGHSLKGMLEDKGIKKVTLFCFDLTLPGLIYLNCGMTDLLRRQKRLRRSLLPLQSPSPRRLRPPDARTTRSSPIRWPHNPFKRSSKSHEQLQRHHFRMESSQRSWR